MYFFFNKNVKVNHTLYTYITNKAIKRNGREHYPTSFACGLDIDNKWLMTGIQIDVIFNIFPGLFNTFDPSYFGIKQLVLNTFYT